MTSYSRSIVTMALSCVISEIFNFENITTLKPGQGSLKVIGTDTDRSAACDFLLTFRSTHGPISYRFRRKSKKNSQSHPTCILCPR